MFTTVAPAFELDIVQSFEQSSTTITDPYFDDNFTLFLQIVLHYKQN